ncbi:MAG: hypothetical protein WDA21_01290 [Bacilli bacterium]
MKKNHIIDKLFNIAIIMIILFSTIFLYNALINYFFGNDDYYINYDEYKEAYCFSDPNDQILITDDECQIQYNEYSKEIINQQKRNSEKNIFTCIGIIVISSLFLMLMNKKDFLKEELGFKILNAILLLVSLAGLLVLYTYIIESLYYNYDDVMINITEIFGFVLFPLIFYYLINKYFYKTKEKH